MLSQFPIVPANGVENRVSFDKTMDASEVDFRDKREEQSVDFSTPDDERLVVFADDSQDILGRVGSQHIGNRELSIICHHDRLPSRQYPADGLVRLPSHD